MSAWKVPPIAVISDRSAARNGRAFWNERFFRFCDDAGIPLLVIGDSETLRGSYRNVRYVRCPDLPEIVLRPEGPSGLGPRPFIAFDDLWAEAEEAEALRTSVDTLARAHASWMDAPTFRALDALREPGWRAPLMSALESVLDAHGVRQLLVTTQSFLGYAATDLARARGDLRLTYLIHSDYPALFGARFSAALPPAERGLVRPVVSAMYRRMVRASIAPGSTVLFRCHGTEQLFRLFGPSRSTYRGVMLPPGIEASPKPPPRAPPTNPLRVLVVARLDHDRNHALLPEIVRHTGSAVFHIAGDGPMRAELEAKLPGAVFHGHLQPDALRARMLESDVLLHTSQTDTFAEAVLEAMSCGLPVVVSNAGGPLGYVLHGHTGMVCSATPDAFAEALRTLRDDLTLWRYLSRNVRAFAERSGWAELNRAVLAEVGAGSMEYGVRPSLVPAVRAA